LRNNALPGMQDNGFIKIRSVKANRDNEVEEDDEREK
jgi:hypothetical protein